MEAIEGAEENNFAAEAPRRRASLIKGELTLARELRLARAVPPRKFALRLGASCGKLFQFSAISLAPYADLTTGIATVSATM